MPLFYGGFEKIKAAFFKIKVICTEAGDKIMFKKKMKILNQRKRKTEETWKTLYIKVYCNEGNNFTVVHLF